MECEEEFERAGLLAVVERFPAVDAKWVRHRRMRGFQNAGKYAHTLGMRMILRKARMERAPAVFIFEDDVTLNAALHDELAKIELPDDWGMFYLGGMHFERPEVIAPGLVKARGMVSTHAFGVRADYFNTIIQALNKPGTQDDGVVPGADIILARLHEKIPSYAVFPNLAGQREGHSDLAGGAYRPFTDDGQQIWLPEGLAGVAAEALGGRAYAPAKAHAERLRAWFRYGPIPKNFNHKLAETEGNAGEEITAKDTKSAKEESGKNIAFLFEGRKGNNPGIWEEFLIGRAQVLYADCADGSGSERIRRRMELLRRALADAENGFFVFVAEGSVPVRPLTDLVRLLEIDGRSRFAWQDAGVAPHTAIPSSLVARHSPWLLLNREAAALLVEDDFSEYFASVAGDADWCYEGTVLSMKGYPLKERVAAQDVCLDVAEDAGSSGPGMAQSALAGMVLGSGRFFVMGKIEALTGFRLHRLLM